MVSFALPLSHRQSRIYFWRLSHVRFHCAVCQCCPKERPAAHREPQTRVILWSSRHSRRRGGSIAVPKSHVGMHAKERNPRPHVDGTPEPRPLPDLPVSRNDVGRGHESRRAGHIRNTQSNTPAQCPIRSRETGTKAGIQGKDQWTPQFHQVEQNQAHARLPKPGNRDQTGWSETRTGWPSGCQFSRSVELNKTWSPLDDRGDDTEHSLTPTDGRKLGHDS